MGSLQSLLKKLEGKRTFIGAVLLSLLGLVGSLDALLHDGHTVWLTEVQYAGIGAFIGGLTGVAMRIAVGRSMQGSELVKTFVEFIAGQALAEHAQQTQQKFNLADPGRELKKDA